jgi:hypothetical protein
MDSVEDYARQWTQREKENLQCRYSFRMVEDGQIVVTN